MKLAGHFEFYFFLLSFFYQANGVRLATNVLVVPSPILSANVLSFTSPIEEMFNPFMARIRRKEPKLTLLYIQSANLVHRKPSTATVSPFLSRISRVTPILQFRELEKNKRAGSSETTLLVKHYDTPHLLNATHTRHPINDTASPDKTTVNSPPPSDSNETLIPDTKEKQLADRAFQLANEVECVDENVKKLLEVSKEVYNEKKKTMTEDPTEENLEKSQQEIKELTQSLKNSDEEDLDLPLDLKDSNASGVNDDNEMEERAIRHKEETKKKEEELEKKEKELDCETSDALKEYTQEARLSTTPMGSNPQDREKILKEKEELVSSPSELSKVEQDMATKDEKKEESLIEDAEEELKSLEEDIPRVEGIVSGGIEKDSNDSCEAKDKLKKKLSEAETDRTILQRKLHLARGELKQAEELNDDALALSQKIIGGDEDKRRDCSDSENQTDSTLKIRKDAEKTNEKADGLEKTLTKLEDHSRRDDEELETLDKKIDTLKRDMLTLDEECQAEKSSQEGAEEKGGCPPTEDVNSTTSPTSEIGNPNLSDRAVEEQKENHEISTSSLENPKKLPPPPLNVSTAA